ncbi:response regulator transcription factor [Flavobacterium agrisoli]|uniref:Response regulator transcription factor n=1 Tax=Flavobacterium agrisoli TaxID=2793066 RepID=A0A934PN76_9FLAO|nr:response regulator transcription factor [Flavobacterium agrisoli]MBK0370013.1 response regulator transcription factor [Flavobacterium agrisoli]
MNSKKIFIIEDDNMTIEILKFIFTKEKYDVYVSKDGLDAIEKIPEILPDLVVTDILLPMKSGLEIIQFIKTNYPTMPVMALSSLGEEEATVADAFNLGVDDFIAKPFNPKELLLRAKRYLK